jgi:ribosomal protein L13E
MARSRLGTLATVNLLGVSTPQLRNLTIRVDVRAIYLAALRAHFERTSLNALIEAFLADYAGIEIAPRPRRRLRPTTYRDLRDEARRMARGR